MRPLRPANIPSWERFSALGIPNVGRKTARDLADHYGSLTALMAASEEELLAIRDVGDVVARSIAGYFADEGKRENLQKLLDQGIAPVYDKKENGAFEWA